MKNSLFLVLATLFILNGFAQQVPSFNKILNIQLVEAERDYGLKRHANGQFPSEVYVDRYDEIAQDYELKKEQYLKFEPYSGLLLEHHYAVKLFSEMDPKTTVKYNYVGDRLEKRVYSSEEKSKQEDFYTYYDDGKLRKTRTVYNGQEQVRNFTWSDDNNLKIESSSIVDVIIENSPHRIVKRKKIDGEDGRFSMYNYDYDQNGNLIGEVYINKDSKVNSTTYILNEYEDISSKIYTSYSDEEITKTHKYLYDKYGNWTLNYTYNNSASMYDRFTEVRLRELKYANGEITGSRDINSAKVKETLEKFKTDKFFENRAAAKASAIPKGLIWKKNEAMDNYWLYMDQELLGGNGGTFMMNNDLYVLFAEKQELYRLSDFKSNAADTFYDADQVNLPTNNGVWFKSDSNKFTAISSDGKILQDAEIYTFAKNGTDLKFKDKTQTDTYILENYKNASINTLYAFKRYDSYVESVTNMVEGMGQVMKALKGECLSGDCENGYGVFKYPDGYKRYGFFEKGRPIGFANVVSADEKTESLLSYDGSIKNKHGFLYTYSVDGDINYMDLDSGYAFSFVHAKNYYTYGTFKNNTYTNVKELKYNGKDKGCVAGNCYNGTGAYRYSDNSYYIGWFLYGKRHGVGEYSEESGTLYIGEYRDDKKHGKGFFLWKKDNYYFGDWKHNEITGKGVVYSSKDNYQAGYWNNSVFVGKTEQSNSEASIPPTSTIKETAAVSQTEYKSANLTETERTSIKGCNADKKCLVRIYEAKHAELGKIYTGDEQIQKTADFLTEMDKITPSKTLSILMSANVPTTVIEKIPPSLKKRMQDEASGIMVDYNNYINSEETRKKIEEHGGIIKN